MPCCNVAVEYMLLVFLLISDNKRFWSSCQNTEVIGQRLTSVPFVRRVGSNSVLVVSLYRKLGKLGFCPEPRIYHFTLCSICVFSSVSSGHIIFNFLNIFHLPFVTILTYLLTPNTPPGALAADQGPPGISFLGFPL